MIKIIHPVGGAIALLTIATFWLSTASPSWLGRTRPYDLWRACRWRNRPALANPRAAGSHELGTPGWCLL
jgi:hypothetical protein